ncbi:MAG: succinate dehydrogenase hydrophobic anchor subunit [Cocleimonas sp.]|jgi:succinate dehydrogenase hydrophobic anchor subunit
MEFLKAIKSVFSAMIGVQKADTLREDFSKKSAMPFIVAGILMTILFVLGVYGIVKLAIGAL